MNQADVTDAVNYGSACLGICLKPEQTQAVRSLLAGEDVFVSLPTGYGKSAIFQVLPFCASYLVSLVNPNPEPSLAVPVVLIVSPLISLVADQVVSLQDKLHVHLPDRRSGSVVSVGTGGNLSTPESLNAFVTHLFGSPESLLGNSQWRSVFTGEFGKRVVAVAVDEAHVVAKWYGIFTVLNLPYLPQSTYSIQQGW